MLLGAMMLSALHAQVVEQGEPTLVYYSPKTSVSLYFSYAIEKWEPGIYAQYAESMLGVNNAVKENKTTYTLKDVRIGTMTTADLSRAHKVKDEAGIPLLLTINEKGILTGYNLPSQKKSSTGRANTSSSKSDKCPQADIKAVPLPEEALKAANPMAQAFTVAKQIFHLRETRMYLINGEVEHSPADGKSMELVLAELDKQEQALTELFLGKHSVHMEEKHVTFAPEDKKHILYFSEENGFTDADNLEASTVVVSVALHPQHYVTNTDKKKKKEAPLSQIVYNLPGSGDVKVLYRGVEMGKRTIPVAQLGVDVPLAKNVFKGETLPVIEFNEKTGNIVSISK